MLIINILVEYFSRSDSRGEKKKKKHENWYTKILLEAYLLSYVY